jgi:SAM-dependent methyltransferase
LLWGSASEDWASLMEPQGRALFEAVLNHAPFGRGSRVLDAGCGSGLFAELIAARGCEVTGLDASAPLLAIARRRLPGVTFEHGDLEALPFPDESFAIVTGINSFQYAADVRRALAEARRVTKPGGQVVVATWGPPHACEAAAFLAALQPLLPPAPAGRGGPFALSDQAALEGLVRSADLVPQSLHDVDVTWHFDDRHAALTAMLSAGPPALAIQTSGRDRVRGAAQEAIAPFRLANGSYRLGNRFRFMVAGRG